MARKTKPVYLSLLLDETGSMLECYDATISGYNEYIGNLKRNGQKIAFTLTKFNAEKIEVVHNAIPITDVPELSRDTYKPNALTPLYDAIGRAALAVEKALAGKKSDVLFVIMTDGEENSSKEYSRQSIFDLIKAKERDGWTFVYLGANQDAYLESGKIGVDPSNAMNYATAQTKSAMRGMAAATVSYSTSPSRSNRDFWNKATVDDDKS